MSKIMKTKITNSIILSLAILAIFALAMIVTVMAFTPKEANAYYYGGYYYSDPYSSQYSGGTGGISNVNVNNFPYNYQNQYNSYNNYNNQFVNPVPGVYTVNPNFINTNMGTTTITVAGYNFTPNSIVKLNNNNLATNFFDSSHLSANINPSDTYGSNNNYISVWNPGPGGGLSNTIFLTVNIANNTYTGNYYTNGVTASTATNNVATTNTTKTSTATTTTPKTVTAPATNNDNASTLASNALFGSSGFMPSGLIQWMFVAIFILLVVIAWRSISGKDKYNSTPMKHA